MAKSGGRQIAGILSLFAGSYLIYSAVSNIGPLRTLLAIVQNPASASTVVKAKQYPISGTPLLSGAAADNSGASANNPTVSGGGGGGPAIVSFARAQIGKPYSSPGDSNTTWDCSGLTAAAVKFGTGIVIPHLVSLQIASTKGSFVSKANLQPGDIVFPQPGHCGVFTGFDTDGTPIMVDAPDYGRTVTERRMWAFMSAKRFSTPANQQMGKP
jgi:cell wall-associated NlpC family hydrolase